MALAHTQHLGRLRSSQVARVHPLQHVASRLFRLRYGPSPPTCIFGTDRVATRLTTDGIAAR